MMRTSIENWRALMLSFGLGENKGTYDYLIGKYAEKHRAYHNIGHIAHCLELLDETPLDEKVKRELEMAIWFHDVIYDSLSKKNELKSAEEAERFLSKHQMDKEVIGRIYSLIMITKHDQPAQTSEEALLMDIDIAILGGDAEAYLAYTQAVRKEYRLIPSFYYKQKRKTIMQSFLQRERLYNSKDFFKRYEKQARVNIQNEINRL